ncbi:MAG: DUF4905 domain-containing protein, partial [Cytophagales bacterium]|nr:DUF4905 domain-containing protein [Cytophagales bacterium]
MFSTGFWTGISEAAYGRLILHGFVSPDRPEPMGIYVYNGQSGQKLWANTEAIFQYSLNSHEGVVATKNLDQIQYSIIDLDSGQFIRTINPGEFQIPEVSE